MTQAIALFPFQHPLGATPRRIWVFPGQGSQKPGMGKALYETSPTYRDVFDRGCAALLEREGVDLKKLIFDGPLDQLTRTLHAQPALLVSNFAFFEHLRVEEEIRPSPEDLMAGHSLGEWTAYTAAGSLTLDQAARAVYWRGRFMEEAFPFDPKAGAPMAAVMDLSSEIVSQICLDVSREGHVVVPANLNAPTQIVISGNPAAVKEASKILKGIAGSKVIPLKVAAPFHSPLMEPVKGQLARKLDELGIRFCPTRNTVIANFTAQPMAPDANHLESLLNQITGSVRWNELMAKAWELGAVEMVSIDVSGDVLIGLAEKIFLHTMPVQLINAADPERLDTLRSPVGMVQPTDSV